MATFPYNRDIPDGPNNPSNDQPLMKENTNSTDEILAVDHVSFEAQNGGTHKQITFFSNNVPGALASQQSVIYTDNGVADATHPQLYWKNTLMKSPLSSVKAFVNFNPVFAPNPTILSQYNISSVTGSGTIYTITLTTDCISSANPIIMIFQKDKASSSSISYTYNNATFVLTVTGVTSSIIGGGTINVLVLEI